MTPSIVRRKDKPSVREVWKDVRKDKWVYLMLLPGICYFLLFKYVPMGGVIIAFQNYFPFKGVLSSEWVGFQNFERLFTDYSFYKLLRNTLMLSLYNIVLGFPAPIIAALMLNELRIRWFKKSIQTMIYLPHFMSWVVVVSMFYVIFESGDGPFQTMIASLGLQPFSIMMNSSLFKPMYILQVLWRETGWGTVIYLAALASVSPDLYEAAKMDGAGRFRQIWHITIPGIRSTIVILLLLRMGEILDLSFEHIFLLLNATNREVADVFDTYVYRVGLIGGQFSYSTAVGLFKGVVGLVLVTIANWLSRRLGEEGIF